MDKKDVLIEYICQDIVVYLIEEKHLEVEEAIDLFYRSKTFSHLLNKENELYLESSGYIYDMFLEECS